jgi:ATP-dependent DNA helicase RecG
MPFRPRSHPPVTRLTRRAFWRRFGRLEHERLEFKRSALHVQEAVVAMAMASGGTILVGVGDDRRIAGCEPVQDALDRVGKVAALTDVELGVRLLRVAGLPVLAVHVPAVPDRVVTTPDGRVLRRVGSANQPLVGDAVARFVRARDATAAALRVAAPPSDGALQATYLNPVSR